MVLLLKYSLRGNQYMAEAGAGAKIMDKGGAEKSRSRK